MSYLEIIYLISAGPGLLIAAIIGLRSLIISKKAISTTECRARLTATAEQIKSFTENIVPKFDHLEQRIADPSITFFAKCELTFDEDGIGLQLTDDIENLNDIGPLFDSLLPALNALSAWCSFFVHNVADEQVAYRTLAPDFLHAAELCLPLIILLEKQIAHTDLIFLYQTWRSRFETEAISEVGEELLDRLQQLRHGALHIKT